MKSLVVYYSLSGKTEKAAVGISERLNSTIRRIDEIKPRNSIIGMLNGSIKAIMKIPSEIRPLDTNLKDFDLIFLGTPIWAGSPTPAIIAFIDEADFKNKQVVLFFTQLSQSNKSALTFLQQKIESKGGKIIGSFSFQTVKRSLDQISEEAKKRAGDFL